MYSLHLFNFLSSDYVHYAFYLIQRCFSLMMFIIHFYTDLMPKTLYLSIFVLPCSTFLPRLQIESLYLHIDQQTDLSVFYNSTIYNCVYIHISVKLLCGADLKRNNFLTLTADEILITSVCISGDFDSFINIASQISPQLINKTALHVSSSSQTNAGAL